MKTGDKYKIGENEYTVYSFFVNNAENIEYHNTDQIDESLHDQITIKNTNGGYYLLKDIN